MIVLSLFLQLACLTADITKTPGEFPDNPTDDYDGDGLTEQGGDCDDLNPEVLGPSNWYADADGDGYGDPNQAFEACLSVLLALADATAYVADNTDCNDGDASIFPNNARYEDDELCVVDADGDGYGDAIPSVTADLGTDCDDSNAMVYPGYNNEIGNLCVLDLDGDGFGQINPPQPYDSGSDCDDDDVNVHPEADEACDGIDNNCSGEIDDYAGSNAPLWYNDADGDGFGNVALSIYACNQPPSHVSDHSDCDDSNPDAYPNAPEYCDGIDTNCNAIEDDPSALDAPQWYTDVDGDGFGSSETVVVQCGQPSGFVSNDGDCNDFSDVQNPNATESCNQQDDNCDGQIDEGVLLDFYIDADGDGYGDVNQIIQACSVPVGASDNGDDCNDGSALVRPGATEICNNIDDDCNGDIDDNALGTSLYYQDSDGDGHGTTAATLISCPIFDPNTGLPAVPSGYSALDDDCDDSDPIIAPSQPELCTENIDENCDGHNTIGAVDVSQYIADSDGDGYGNDAFILDFCYAPLGYVAYDPSDEVDCNDNDSEVNPSVPASAEICNGRLDSCDNQWNGISPPVEEIDEDGDGFVACVLDVDPVAWLGDSILGDGDCEDDNPDAYPGAAEICNGIAEDCDDPFYGSSPALETDNDFDGYVECNGFDVLTWQGSLSVIGGGDCQDNSDFTYPGAAVNSPDVCAQDLDNDGDPDCNLTGISSNYFCDSSVFPSVGLGPDFVLIPAGNDPLGRYSISFDFYMMTTEISEGMWDGFMGSGSSTSHTGKNNVTWHDAAAFANALSAFVGYEECYSCNGSTCSELVLPITDCLGYRLPTEWEWEYAARSGTTAEFWTGEGVDLGGDYSSNNCNGTEVIIDGVSNPLIGDYAWYCGNNDGFNILPIAQKLPNGFGLYDMHGNLYEWTADWYGNFNPSGIDPWNANVDFNRLLRGGYMYDSPVHLRASNISADNPSQIAGRFGFRLMRRIP